jgi:Ca2+-binding EF-hand superfamily protein
MASRKAKVPKKRVQRATSNVFAMFDQAQIQEFKEAFNMIDQDHDSFIDKDDLQAMFASLGLCSRLPSIHSFKCTGKALSDSDLQAMIDEAPGQINFTMFLTLFGEKLTGTDPEEVVFVCVFVF